MGLNETKAAIIKQLRSNNSVTEAEMIFIENELLTFAAFIDGARIKQEDNKLTEMRRQLQAKDEQLAAGHNAAGHTALKNLRSELVSLINHISTMNDPNESATLAGVTRVIQIIDKKVLA
jgi:uncharacterized protein YaaR (DUF327 family)